MFTYDGRPRCLSLVQHLQYAKVNKWLRSFGDIAAYIRKLGFHIDVQGYTFQVKVVDGKIEAAAKTYDKYPSRAQVTQEVKEALVWIKGVLQEHGIECKFHHPTATVKGPGPAILRRKTLVEVLMR